MNLFALGKKNYLLDKTKASFFNLPIFLHCNFRFVCFVSYFSKNVLASL